ncbi:SET domain protein, putative [Plasmodium malariae]|uniref:SET domain protein, putative n=1 Tax=Plasmodium malariae TaxID=5858 RepID=A0A1D3JJK4_PLAMA|nr:SET domain protein, putative [Plasmodium malariae]SBT86681.1 SET domain protein, putative [Plasmodium malariae]
MFDVALLKDIEHRGLRDCRLERIKQNNERMNEKEKEELIELAKELPKLYERNEKEVIPTLIASFIERYPKSIEGYTYFIKFHLNIEDYKSTLNFLYAAIYIDKENKSLMYLLKECEERLVSQISRIPMKYKNFICYSESRTDNDEKYTNRSSDYYNADYTYDDLIYEEKYRNKMHIVKQGQYYMVLAKKDLVPGEIIIRTKPFVLTQYIFSNHYTYSTCYHCLRERNISQKSYACPINPHTCSYIFCNYKCLIDNIKVHKIECTNLGTILAASKECKLSYYTVLHIFRVLIKTRIDKEYKDKEHTILSEIFSHHSYYDAVKENQKELFESFNTLANRIILEFPSSFYLYLKQKELVQFMLIIWQYSPFIKYYSPSSILQQANPETTFGLVYSTILAKIHHSCVPTCTFYYDEDGYLTIRSLCNIPQGGKLCISLLADQYLPLKIRKSFKSMPRIFSCGCIRCSDPTENNLHLRSMKCPKCVIGYIYPLKTRSLVEALKLHWFGQIKKETIHDREEPSRRGTPSGKSTKNRANRDSQVDKANRLEGMSTSNEANISNEESISNEASVSNSNSRAARRGRSPKSGQILVEEKKKKKILNRLEKEMERWVCGNCGKISFKGNKKCIKLENKIYLQYNEAEHNYMNGNTINARNQLLHLYKEFFYILHPNHYILFNTCVLLAGLLRNEPNKQLFESLRYLRKAVIAAENVFPICSLEKVHLYTHLAHYTFSCSNLYKLYNKGMGVLPNHVIEPMYKAIWNSCVISGYNSTLSIVLTQQLRTYAISFNLFTPCKDIKFDINRKEEFCSFYSKVTQKKNAPFKEIKKVVEEDYFFPIYMACQCFDINFEKNKFFKSIFISLRTIQYFGNGLNALCLAASFGNVNLVKLLLKLKYSLFLKNELHMNALLYMASSFLPDEQTSYHSNYYYTLLKEIELQSVQLDEFERNYSNWINAPPNNANKTKTELLISSNNNNYLNYCHLKNDIEQPFPFDVVVDEDLIYGERSKEMDTNQKIILTLFLKYLDKKHIKKKKKFKNRLTLNERIKFGEEKRSLRKHKFRRERRGMLLQGKGKIHRDSFSEENLSSPPSIITRHKKSKPTEWQEYFGKNRLHYGKLSGNNMSSDNMSSDNMSSDNTSSDKKNRGNMNRGNMNIGNMHSGNMHSGNMHSGNMHSGNMHSGNMNSSNKNSDNTNNYDNEDDSNKKYDNHNIFGSDPSYSELPDSARPKGEHCKDDKMLRVRGTSSNYSDDELYTEVLSSSNLSILRNGCSSSGGGASSGGAFNGDAFSSGTSNNNTSNSDTSSSSGDSVNSDDVLNSKVKNYYSKKFLTQSISHRLLGLNNALHYACARGKRELAKQLIISGMPVMLLNDEGSTPLHMAALKGHTHIVKTLINYKSDVNALSSHGETPLMLATYGLHFEVVKILIEHDAKTIINNKQNTTVLHCLVLGLLRTHTIYYKSKTCRDDIATLTIQGFSELGSSTYYTQAPSYLSTNYITANIPIIEQLPHDFFLFPFKLLHRVKKAVIIMKYLMMLCPIYLYEIKNSNGYNPFELLKATWKKLCEKRIQVMAISDIRISSFSEKQKNIVQQAWTLITSLVNVLISVLIPDRSVITSIYKNLAICNGPMGGVSTSNEAKSSESTSNEAKSNGSTLNGAKSNGSTLNGPKSQNVVGASKGSAKESSEKEVSEAPLTTTKAALTIKEKTSTLKKVLFKKMKPPGPKEK